MNSEDYRKISLEVSQKLNNYFVRFCEQYPQYALIKEDYIKKSIHLNGVQFYAGFISGASQSWEDYIEIPIAIEMIMLWAYKTNRILDEKHGVYSDKEIIKLNVLQHDLMLSCIQDLIGAMSKKEDLFIIQIQKYIWQMLASLPYGFWVERDKLDIQNSSLQNILLNWEEEYIKRNINFNLVYEYASLIGYSLSVKNFNIIDVYVGFMPMKLRFSNVGQMINDLGDFSENTDLNVKSYQDMFSDIRNGIITFPVYKLINEKKVQSALENPLITKDSAWQNDIRELIIKNDIHKELILLSFQSYNKLNDFFEKHIVNNNPILLKTFGMLINNKYFNQEVLLNTSPFFRNMVCLCNENGKELGTYEKIAAHKEGRLHKAFSILVFNKNREVLLQKRAKEKYHSGGLWSNTCCSHQISGDSLTSVAVRRLKEEMGFACELREDFTLLYKLDVGNGLIEHEYNNVLLGEYDGPISPNQEEVEEYKWIKLDDLVNEIRTKPEDYTEWFKVILEKMGYNLK